MQTFSGYLEESIVGKVKNLFKRVHKETKKVNTLKKANVQRPFPDRKRELVHSIRETLDYLRYGLGYQMLLTLREQNLVSQTRILVQKLRYLERTICGRVYDGSDTMLFPGDRPNIVSQQRIQEHLSKLQAYLKHDRFGVCKKLSGFSDQELKTMRLDSKTVHEVLATIDDYLTQFSKIHRL